MKQQLFPIHQTFVVPLEVLFGSLKPEERIAAYCERLREYPQDVLDKASDWLQENHEGRFPSLKKCLNACRKFSGEEVQYKNNSTSYNSDKQYVKEADAFMSTDVGQEAIKACVGWSVWLHVRDTGEDITMQDLG